MYFGTSEIKDQSEIPGTSGGAIVLTFVDGKTLAITNKNKLLITEQPQTGSELQYMWAKNVAQDIVDVYYAHNVRLVDTQLVEQLVKEIINGKNEEKLVEIIGKEKLDTLASAFGATQDASNNSVRNITIQDIFTK